MKKPPERLEQKFQRQGLASLLKMKLRYAERGVCLIHAEFEECLTQHHGHFHAGVQSSLADTAAGFAALSLTADATDIVTSEFKISFLRPACGERLAAEARVIRDGRKIKVVRASVYAIEAGRRHHCAEFLGSMFVLQPESRPRGAATSDRSQGSRLA